MNTDPGRKPFSCGYRTIYGGMDKWSGGALPSGFTVYASSSGLEGVEAVREHNPVITIIDVGLPDFDGIEACRRIRTFSDAYLIIVTGRTEEADARMGFEAGAEDFLTKPLRPRELRARITAMLRRPRSLSPSRRSLQRAPDTDCAPRL